MTEQWHNYDDYKPIAGTMNQVTPHLWITDIEAAREQDTSRFDAVITVCQDSVEANVSDDISYCHHPLTDGEPQGHVQGDHDPQHGSCITQEDDSFRGDNSYEGFAQAVDDVLVRLNRGDDTLVHCHVGRSRSVAVACAALAVVKGLTYDQAFTLVKEARPIANPNPALRTKAEKYIESHQ